MTSPEKIFDGKRLGILLGVVSLFDRFEEGTFVSFTIGIVDGE